jgi:hypothetical protein
VPRTRASDARLARGLVAFDVVGLEIRGVFLQVLTAARRGTLFRAQWGLVAIAGLAACGAFPSRHPFLLVL